MIDKKLFNLTVWLFAGIALLVIVTSCAPLAAYEQEPTAEPTATQRPILSIVLSVTPSPTSQSCTVTGQTVYLRAGAGMRYEPLTVLRDGEQLEVLKRGAWLFVLTRNRAGYVSSNYCKE